MSDSPADQTEGLSASTSSELQPVEVEAIAGPATGERALLTAGMLVVGSQKGCGLTLDDRAVSKQHVSLQLLAGAVRVRDLGSRNGTRYLGAKIDEARVPIGGSIQVGRTTLRFKPSPRETRLSDRRELHGLLGVSPAMRRLFALIERIGPQDSTLVIRGEVGAGKEAVARAIHSSSPRAAGPFVVFDSGAVSTELFESALFGHVRGAFTGALQDKAGTVALAQGGVLLLDRVSELPAALQPKLLRLLELHEYQPVGGSATLPADFRVIATTQTDLEKEVEKGRFRSDLYYRLSVATVDVPPLRERREDIPLLAAHFARERTGLDVKLSPTTLATLQCDDWPGNVRELRNAVERVVALGLEAEQGAASAPAGKRGSFKEQRAAMLGRFERDYLVALLQASGGKMAAAAREAGVSRMMLYRLLKRHGIEAADVAG